MTDCIDIQHATSTPLPFDDKTLQSWARLVLTHENKQAIELTLRFVDPTEITSLNTQYRQKSQPTNVLAFPSQLPECVELEHQFIGDVVICPEILLQESVTLKKSLEAHWALIVIHGILHLLGYDHINDEDALIMQSIEIELLKKLNFGNPYHEDDHIE